MNHASSMAASRRASSPCASDPCASAGAAATSALSLALALALAACGGGRTDSPVASPGAPASAVTRALDKGAAVLQDKPPVEALNAYLDGFHFYSGRLHEQMEAHHYCSVLNEDITQCVIFDASTREAKLMGVEYIVSAKLFATLSGEEKALWHSHVHEVKSGQLVAPGIPAPAELALMRKLVGTYGKTWHTWHTDHGQALPLGAPQLMMGFTADGQVNERLVAERDRRLGVDNAAKRRERADIPAPAIDPGADAWQRGSALQLGQPQPSAAAASR